MDVVLTGSTLVIPACFPENAAPTRMFVSVSEFTDEKS